MIRQECRIRSNRARLPKLFSIWSSEPKKRMRAPRKVEFAPSQWNGNDERLEAEVR